jgi:hypothetical protein
MTDDNARDIADSDQREVFPGQQIASLSSRLARRPPQRHKEPVNEADVSPTGPRAVSDRVAAPAAAKSSEEATSRATPRPNATQATTRNVALSLDVVTKDALRKAAREAQTSQAEIIYQSLEQYVANEHTASSPEWKMEGLFQRSTSPQAGRPKSLHTLRLPARNLEVIDDLVEKTGHANRSALVEAALSCHLLTSDESDADASSRHET